MGGLPEDKRAVLKLVFAERLPYHRNEGYRTAKTSLPFKALEDIHMGKFEMVPEEECALSSLMY